MRSFALYHKAKWSCYSSSIASSLAACVFRVCFFTDGKDDGGEMEFTKSRANNKCFWGEVTALIFLFEEASPFF